MGRATRPRPGNAISRECPEGRHAADARERLSGIRAGKEPDGSPGRWSVQLGAFSDEAAARAALLRYAGERASDLSGITRATGAQRHRHGCLAAAYGWLPEPTARDLCGRLRAGGVDCVPVVD